MTDTRDTAAPQPREGNEAMNNEIVSVTILPTAIWIEDDICGGRHVMLQHEGMDPFCYASFQYDYAYTSNSGTHAVAHQLAVSLGATEPVEHRSRAFPKPGEADPETLREVIDYYGADQIRSALDAASPTAPPPTQPEGHEAWMLEAERLLTTFEYAVIGATTPYGSIDTASKARAALLAHLRTKIDAARGADLSADDAGGEK
jgi:hypothetical protein